jgi:hypothetical protein
MADNVAITAGSGTSIAADDISSVWYQRVKLSLGADGSAVDAVAGNGTAGTSVMRVTLASDSTGVVTGLAPQVTVSTDITRPADTTAYAAGDNLSDSTSAPVSGGFTFTSAARASGGTGIITDMIIATSNPAATPLQGEVWIFDTSVTNINDNSAFAISDSEVKTVVAKIPFTMVADTNNSLAHVQNLNIGFTAVGSANLRFLVKVKSAYTPISAEVITTRLKIIQTS